MHPTLGRCHPWTGGVGHDGYGLFYAGGKDLRAHRFALELKLGRALTSDEVTRHACDYRLCCNDDHLCVGSIADNNADMLARGRYARGARHANAKLTESSVREIRALAGTVPYETLAQRFGVTDRAVRYVADGKRWRHIEGATP